MIHFSPVEHHIEDRGHTRLCDGRPASDTDVLSEDWFALRDARKAATLCSDCQDNVNPRDVRWDLYGYDRMSTAHLYAVPVLAAFDAIRNCSHCRRNTNDNCKAWREARESVAVLTQESRRLAKGVDELLDATCGRMANIYVKGGGKTCQRGVAVQRKCPLKCAAIMSSRNLPCYQTKMSLTPVARVT